MGDREWLVPSIALTVLSAVVALLLIPSYHGILPAVGILPLWMLVAALIGAIYGFFAMAAKGVSSPFRGIHDLVIGERRRFLFIAFAMVLAGINLTTFMWTKPLLNHLVPFWADPLLADVDYWLFLGHDPWAFFAGLNSGPMAIFYHRGWIALLILTLIITLCAPPSPRKSAIIVSYFALWSIAGPLIHILLPATGPIFYAQMGYGDRFAGLHNVSETREMADYLWNLYATRSFGPGAGISAMPSMHITTTVWMLIAIRVCAPRLFWPMLAAGILIFILSVALGWHYAVDGIVGGAVAFGLYKALLLFYRRHRRASGRAAMVMG